MIEKTEIDTAAKPAVNREIATTLDGRDITRGYVGPLLLPYDSVLRQRGANDLLIYESVLSEPQVQSVLQQRRLAVTKCEWHVEPGGTKRIDIKAAEHLEEQLKNIGWDRVTNLMLYGVFYGYAVSELIYSRDAQYITLAAIKVRNRRRFRFAPDGGLRMLTPERMTDGVPAPAPYFWHFATGSDNDDEPYGLGLAHWLYWPVLFKRNGLKFWLLFTEKFGSPTAVGKYEATASPAEKQQLLAATRAIQTDAGIIMPTGMELDLLEASRTGTGTYDTLHDRMDATIAKVVLGQSASSEGTPGKLGGDEMHQDVRQDIVKADADLICESFNLGPAQWLTKWNFPGAAFPRIYREIEEPEDLSERADRDTKLKALGYKPKLSYIHETYGADWEEAQAETPVDSKTPASPGNRLDDNAAQAAAAADDFAEAAERNADAPARMAGALDAKLQPTTDAWLQKIRDLVEKSATLEQIRDGLTALAPEMDLDAYTLHMREALAAAAMAGRYEILREAGA